MLSLKQLTEEGRLEQVGEDGRVEKFDPALQLGNLHNIVSELRSQPAGKYILSHDAKSGAFCRLLKPDQGGKHFSFLVNNFFGLKCHRQNQKMSHLSIS